MTFASGKYALALCDRCGQQYKYLQLQQEWNGLFTCPECFEPKHPQLDPQPHRVDPEALRDPRPTEPAPTIHLGKIIVSNPKDSQGVSSPIMFAKNSNTIGTQFDGFKATASLGEISIVT